MTNPTFDSPPMKTVTIHPGNHRLAVVCLALLCAGTSAVQAATHHFMSAERLVGARDPVVRIVTNLADSGPGSLRAALASAADGDAIDWSISEGTILLTGGELLVTTSVTILAPTDRVTVDGNSAGRVFHIGPGHDVSISGLIITNGRSSAGGGGIYNDRSKLTISNCTLSGNSTRERGGGIYNNGSYGSATLVIANSTLSDNSADQGGGIYNNGYSGDTMLVINNSTLSGNSARGEQGSAIYNLGGRNLGVRNRARRPGRATVRIVNSTLSGNSIRVAHGGAIFNKRGAANSSATLKIGSTILDAGTRGRTIYNEAGSVVSDGYNLSSDNGGGFLAAPGDQRNTDPMLGPLTDNGGPTLTHWVPTSSPAIDAGFNFAETGTDQRGAGFARSNDAPSVPNGTGGDSTDIGSFEFRFNDPFPNGVAAGDVNQSIVVLWARARERGTVWFEYGTDPTFASHQGFIGVEVSDPEVPAKHLTRDLQAGTQYYYRALFGPNPSNPEAIANSVSGKFRTPFFDGSHGLRFGVSSCFQNDRKPFIAIRNVPERDLDFFVALGDTSYNDKDQVAIGRDRDRYQDQLGKDEFLVSARESTAFYATIDDHEVRNDFKGGAPTSDDPGTDLLPTPNYVRNEVNDLFNETNLFKSSLQAFTEYWPIEYYKYGDTPNPLTRFKQKLYRRRTFGDDAAFFMLDTRSFRQEPDGNEYTEDISMISVWQRNELLGDLVEEREKTWKFVLTSVPMQSMATPDLPYWDRWDGFAWERRVILNQIKTNNIKNVVFISGDIHGTVSNELIYQYGRIGGHEATKMWEITTGPVGHTALFANLYGLFPDGEGARSGENLDFEGRFNFFQGSWPDAGLYNSPYATLLRGQYVSITTFSWTEFEILANKNLLVTTWGVYYYGPGAPGGVDFPRSTHPPYILQQFEVTHED